MTAQSRTSRAIPPANLSRGRSKAASSEALQQTPQDGRSGSDPFPRSKLVGKFPHIRHQPAPKGARLMLSDEDRARLLAMMVLV